MRLGGLPEGDLSRVRANLVKQDTLHQLALKLQLPELMRLGEGELRSGRQAASILADVFGEALIGAVYLDAGYAQAQALVQRLFQDVDITPSMQTTAKDPKTALQEWLQVASSSCPCTRWWAPPVWRTSRALMSSAPSPNCGWSSAASADRAVRANRAAAAMLQT